MTVTGNGSIVNSAVYVKNMSSGTGSFAVAVRSRDLIYSNLRHVHGVSDENGSSLMKLKMLDAVIDRIKDFSALPDISYEADYSGISGLIKRFNSEYDRVSSEISSSYLSSSDLQGQVLNYRI